MRFVLLSMIVLAGGLSGIENGAYTYRSVTGDRTNTYIVSWKEDRNIIRLSSSNVAGTRDTDCIHALNGAMLRWESTETWTIIGVRSNTAVHFSGTLAGKPVVGRSVELGAIPWYQLFELPIALFVRSGSREQPFWVVNPADLTANNLMMIREGTETITVGGVSRTALRVRMTILGPFSMFWSALYWCRADDGICIKFDRPNGMPGTPITCGELIAEK
ncbi:MAG: hypothetical protein AABZ39_12890 [Spirochaetota bacterium]